MLAIQHANSKKVRKQHYCDLLKVTRNTVGYVPNCIDILQPYHDGVAIAVCQDLKATAALALRVIDQSEKRVLHGLTVPAAEKVVSIFEPHTDVIVKDRRDTFYGHKVYLTGGRSNLITDCVIEDGNPADSQLGEKMLNRHNDIYGQYPLKVAFDGSFASKDNLKTAKSMKIKDVCFPKKRGLQVENMGRSDWVYNRLRCYRKRWKIERTFLGLATIGVWLFDMNVELPYIKHFFILHVFSLF